MVLAVSGLVALVTRLQPTWRIYGAFAGVLLLALLLDAADQKRAAAIVLPLGFWSAASLAVFLLGGVRSPGLFVYLPVVITAALFWSWRAAGGLTAASVLVGKTGGWPEREASGPVRSRRPRRGPCFASSQVRWP